MPDGLSSADSHRVTDMTYDGAGRLTDVTGGTVDDGSGNMVRPVTHTDYDANGNVADTINPRLKEWVYTYDDRNRKSTETQPAVLYQVANVNPQLAWTYDDAGNVLTVKDARQNVTTFVYDPANRKTDVIQPLVSLSSGGTAQPTTHTDYDPAGNAVKVTDANLHLTVNAYDPLNRLSLTTDAKGIQVAYCYDEVGNRTLVKDGLLQLTHFKYDGLNRNTRTTNAAGQSTVLNYDALNKTSRVDALDRETDYTYDLRNRLTGIIYIGRTTDNRGYVLDAVGNLLSVTEPNQTAANVAYTYDALNRVSTETSGGLTHDYKYDLAGNRLNTVYAVGTAATRTIVSDYDALNRLNSMTESGRTSSYGYDLNGNITQKTAPNGDTETVVFDALNRDTSQTSPTCSRGWSTTAMFCMLTGLGGKTEIGTSSRISTRAQSRWRQRAGMCEPIRGRTSRIRRMIRELCQEASSTRRKKSVK